LTNSAWFAPTGQGVEFTNCPVTEPARVLVDESMVLAGQVRTTKFHIRLPNYQERKYTNSKLADILRRRYVMICSNTMLSGYHADFLSPTVSAEYCRSLTASGNKETLISRLIFSDEQELAKRLDIQILECKFIGPFILGFAVI
jgi:hypothetical protein